MAGYRIVVLGQEDDPPAPTAYAATLRALLARLDRPEWLLWWTGSDSGVLEVWYAFDGDAFRVSTRRRGDVVTATLHRPRHTRRAGRRRLRYAPRRRRPTGAAHLTGAGRHGWY